MPILQRVGIICRIKAVNVGQKVHNSGCKLYKFVQTYKSEKVAKKCLTRHSACDIINRQSRNGYNFRISDIQPPFTKTSQTIYKKYIDKTSGKW